MISNKKSGEFISGVNSGIPIALGYLSVSFGFGISAVSRGLSPFAAVLISLTNLTSAGQVAGLEIIVTAGTLIEMALAQLTINARYFMMSLSLSQKIPSNYRVIHRLLTSFGITDEVFGVAASRKEPLTTPFMYGLILLPFIGWSMGTLMGAVAGNILPDSIKAALGIAIYGMFVAIVVPPAKTDKGCLTAVLVAIALSCIIAYVPLFDFITSGFSIIICALCASAVAAYFFPIKDSDGEGQETSAEGEVTDNADNS
ncbi:MAG: AzlC family ABC transporter permease [Clostridia bacterium]|nr:AzlC family ABC transporter permease [Clostridia bacterium]